MKSTSIKMIPKFKNEHEEAKFWKTHSITEFEDELSRVKNVHFPRPRKRLISLRMDDTLISALKKSANKMGVGYLTLIRIWIIERLSLERYDSKGNSKKITRR